MGLDVAAYQKAELTEPHEHTDACWDQHEWVRLTDESFAPSYRGLVPDRCYVLDEAGYHFYAGAYSAYNRWRDELSRRAVGVPAETVWEDPPKYADRGFIELINFSDCEGQIGPEACAALAHDFESQRERVATTPAYHKWPSYPADYFMERYDDFTRAFKIAAGSGLVDFH